MSVLFTEKVELLQVNPNGTSGFLRANSQGDIVLWDGIFTEGQTALNRQSWTGDGSTTTFAITNPVQDILMLDINGLIYPLSEYDVTGQTLTITPAVTAGYLITLTYFESLTGQGQSTGISDAINGLTNSNNVAELGGTLYKDTTINAANSSFYILDSTYLNKTALFGVLTNINFGLANLSDYIGVYQETVTTFQAMGLDRNSDSLLIRSLNTSTNIDNTFTMDADGSSDIKINNTDPTLGVAEIHLSQGSLLMNFNNKFTITDTKTTGARTGIQYAEDYTFDGTATNLTLATKGYVDTEITAVTYTEGEGIDLTSNVFSFKNSSNLTDNFLVKWDDTNTQLASTVFQDNGTGGWAIGIDAVPNDKNSVILGFKSVNGVTTINSNVVSIGYLTNTNASTVGLDSISIGSGASAASADDIVIGSFATTILGNGGIAIGSLASATTDLASIPSIAIGTFANAIQRGEIVIGRNAATDTGPHADYSVTIGDSANSGNSGTSGFGGVTIGYNTLGTNVVIGDNASGNISIGSNSLSGSSSVAIAGTADKTESIAILGNTDQLRAVAISGTVTGTLGVVVGRFSSAGASAVAIGTSTFASANAVAIGPNSGAGTGTKNDSYVAIGQSAGSAVDIGTNAVLIGNATDATKSSGVAVGDGAQSLALNGVAIGSSAKVDDLGNDSIAILANSGVGINNVLIGTGSTILVGKNAVGIGPNVSSTADSTVSIGDTVAVTAAGGIAIGHNINAGASGAIMMGGNVVDVLENNISNSVGFGWSGTNGIPNVLFAEIATSYINNTTGLVIGSDSLETSAILELQSLSKAFLVSRVADPATDVTAPVNGMIVFDSTDLQLQAYIDGAWRNIGGAGINPTGTENTLSKFTSTGDDLVESRIIDNGNQYSFGTFTNVARSGEIVHANNTIEVLGDAQTAKMIATAQTSDDTPTEMFLNSVNSRIVLQLNSVVGFVITLTALEIESFGAGTNGTNGAGTNGAGTNGVGTTNPARIAQYKGGIKNIDTTVLVDTVTEIILAVDFEAENWGVNVYAYDLYNTLRIDVTGEIGKVINWVANIELTETKF